MSSDIKNMTSGFGMNQMPYIKSTVDIDEVLFSLEDDGDKIEDVDDADVDDEESNHIQHSSSPTKKNKSLLQNSSDDAVEMPPKQLSVIMEKSEISDRSNLRANALQITEREVVQQQLPEASIVIQQQPPINIEEISPKAKQDENTHSSATRMHFRAISFQHNLNLPGIIIEKTDSNPTKETHQDQPRRVVSFQVEDFKNETCSDKSEFQEHNLKMLPKFLIQHQVFGFGNPLLNLILMVIILAISVSSYNNNKDVIGSVKYEVETYDESLRSVDIPLNLPLTNIFWFSKDDISNQAENSVQFMCNILGRFTECIQLKCKYKTNTFEYSYKYEIEFYNSDEMSLCLKENMGIKFCDYIEEEILKLVCQNEFGRTIDKDTQSCLKLIGWERQTKCIESLSQSVISVREPDLDRSLLTNLDNLQTYLCDNAQMSLNRASFHEYMGFYRGQKWQKQAKCQVFFQNNTLVAIKHFFNQNDTDIINFSRYRPQETTLQLGFSNEFVGTKTRSILYNGNQTSPILYAEKYSREVRNLSMAQDPIQMVCNNISDYLISKTLAQNLANYSAVLLLNIEHQNDSSIFANNLIFQPKQDKSIEIRPGLTKQEFKLNPNINLRQVFIIDFEYKVRVTKQYFYDQNQYNLDFIHVLCYSMCVFIVLYEVVFVRLAPKFFLFIRFGLNEAIDIQNKVQISPLFDSLKVKKPQNQPQRSSEINFEGIKQQIEDQLKDRFQTEQSPTAVPGSNFKKEIKIHIENYDKILKKQIDEKLQKINKKFNKEISNRDEIIQKYL